MLSSKANSSQLAVFAFVLLALSGCLGGRDGGAGPTPGAGYGAIQGRVLEEAGLPLPETVVRVLLLDRNATTGEDGAFRLDAVPAGPWRLLASAPGHASATRDVQVSAQTIHRVDFTLRTLTLPDPRHPTVNFPGRLSCNLVMGVHCGQALPQEDSTHRFPVESGLRAVLVELEWDPTLPAAAQRLHVNLRAATDTACGTGYAEASSESPVRLLVREGFPTRGGHQCLVVRAASDQAAVDQPYEAHVTLFYHEDAPEGFTAIPA